MYRVKKRAPFIAHPVSNRACSCVVFPNWIFLQLASVSTSILCSSCCTTRESNERRTFATKSHGKLNILGHNGNSLGMNGAKVHVLKDSYKVCFGSFLKVHEGGTLKTSKSGVRNGSPDIFRNFAHESLERRLGEQEVCRLLIATNLSKLQGE